MIPRRGPNLAPAHDEEIAGIRRVHEAMRIKHQGLIRARLFSLKTGQNAVQLGMRIVFRILAHRQAAHLRHGGQLYACAGQAVHGLGMFHDDHQRRTRPRQRGVLKRPHLDAAGQHQAAVYIRDHPIGAPRPLERLENTRAVHPNIKANGFAAIEKAIHMLIEKSPDAVVKAHPLPHAVAQKKPAVIDRDRRLGTRLERAIDVDQDVAVARIFEGVMGGGVIGVHRLPLGSVATVVPRAGAVVKIDALALWRTTGRGILCRLPITMGAMMQDTGINQAEDPTGRERLTREDGRFVIPAALIAARFGLIPSMVPELMRVGQITSQTEMGTEADAGRWRLTLYHKDHALRLTVDEAGAILHQTRFAAPRRALSPR